MVESLWLSLGYSPSGISSVNTSFSLETNKVITNKQTNNKQQATWHVHTVSLENRHFKNSSISFDSPKNYIITEHFWDVILNTTRYLNIWVKPSLLYPSAVHYHYAWEQKYVLFLFEDLCFMKLFLCEKKKDQVNKHVTLNQKRRMWQKIK